MKLLKIGNVLIFIAIGAIGAVTALILFNNAHSPRDKKSIGDEIQPEPGVDKKIIELDESALKVIIHESLSKYLSVSNLNIVISSDKTVMIASDINTNDLSKLINESSLKIPAAAKLFLKFLPETVSTVLKLTVDTDKENKLILLEPVEFKINDIAVSGSMLPDKIKTSFNDSINQFLISKKIIVNDLEFTDGKIIIKPF